METHKKLKIPNTFVLICSIIGIMAILTWFVPGGQYQTVEKNGRMVTDPNSFEHVPSNPQGMWDALKAPIRGFEGAAEIIAFVLLVGGAFSVLQRTKAIDVGIEAIVRRHENSRFVRMALIPLFMTMFSFGGAVFGMSEETIPFILVFVPLALAIGYDSVIGVAIPFVGAGAGFAGAFLNPFTIGIAQGIADVPLFSGMGYRFIVWILTTVIAITFVMWYAQKIKKNPSLSPTFQSDEQKRKLHQKQEVVHLTEKGATRNQKLIILTFSVLFTAGVAFLFYLFLTNQQSKPISFFFELNLYEFVLLLSFTLFAIFAFIQGKGSEEGQGISAQHLGVLFTFALSLLLLVIGVTRFDWYIIEIAGLFFFTAILVGKIGRLSLDEMTDSFMEGAKSLVSTALIIGFAKAIVVVAEDGKIIHTILYSLASSVEGLHPVFSSQMMFLVQTCINFLIPSGSGQAALTMPIMAPLADLVGVTRQTAVLAYQLGDGFTNLIIPTSPVLMGVLTLADIPWTKWAKWMLPLQLIFILFGLLILIPAFFMNWS